MSAKAPQNRQTGGAYTDGDSKAYREAFTEEVCDALYLKAPRLVKRLQRVPTRDVRLAGRACKYSAVLMRGVYPWDPTKPCQDSFFVNESMVVDGLASHWFAVMDGHGPDGDGCAHFIRDNLEKVARKLHKKHPDWSWADVLSNSYETVNAMLHRSDRVSSVDSGSTLVSVCIRRDVCYCANVGDSRAIIGTLDRSTGRFSRSIGDYTAETVGCIATPEISETAVGEDDVVVVIASDGVWEFLTNQVVLDMCLETDDPFVACNRIVAKAAYEWVTREQRTDDISCIVVYLNDRDGKPLEATPAAAKRRLSVPVEREEPDSDATFGTPDQPGRVCAEAPAENDVEPVSDPQAPRRPSLRTKGTPRSLVPPASGKLLVPTLAPVESRRASKEAMDAGDYDPLKSPASTPREP
ncbi:protein serine/threonine phosphatase [Aureococcus anophagefferens]|nr:protein serine/threonine phosphatase [Aureococcus anophagefferens]